MGLVGRARSSSARGREGEGLGTLDQVALELAPQVALEAVELVAVERRPLVAPLGRRLGAGGQAQGAADPLHVDPDHAGALGLAEGGDRQPRQVAQAVLVAGFDRVADLLAQLLHVDPLAALADRVPFTAALAALGDLALDRLGLGGAEEKAVEQQLEDAAVLLRLGDRRRQRLAEVVARGPVDHLQGGEGVEDLRGPDRHALAAQLVAEAEQLCRQAGRAGVGLGPVGRGGAHRTDNRRVSSEQTVALGELRAARRRRFVAQIDVMEVLYRVYLAAIFGGIALAVIAGWVEEAPASASAIADMKEHGPAVLGLALALAVLMGLRSGARGGPLAIEAAEVQYVLLAPIDRGAALRPAAWRQLRIAVIAGAVLGAVIGNFVFRRLPGSPVAWIACLALLGALLPLCALAAALLASGRRLRPLVASALGVGLIAWTLADLLLGATTSPATLAGEIGTLPLPGGGSHLVLAGVGLAIALALAWLGLRAVAADRPRGGAAAGGADRRAALLGLGPGSAHRRAAAPPARLRAAAAAALDPPGAAASSRYPVWRRGWQSFLRWPLGRVVRVLAIGLAAGAATAAAWSGVTLLFVLPGLLLMVAALDLVEPLAQETDHPTRRELLPLAAANLIQRHLVPSFAAMAAVLLCATLAALALGPSASAAGVGVAMLFPTALVLVCCAALSATNDPYAYILNPRSATRSRRPRS